MSLRNRPFCGGGEGGLLVLHSILLEVLIDSNPKVFIDEVPQVFKKLFTEGARPLGLYMELLDHTRRQLGGRGQDALNLLAVAEAALGMAIINGLALLEPQTRLLVAPDAHVAVRVRQLHGADVDARGLGRGPQLGLGETHDGRAELQLLAVLTGGVVLGGMTVPDVLIGVVLWVEELLDWLADGLDDVLDRGQARGGDDLDHVVGHGLVAPGPALGVEELAVCPDLCVVRTVGQDLGEPFCLAQQPPRDQCLVLIDCGAGNCDLAWEPGNPPLDEGHKEMNCLELLCHESNIVQVSNAGDPGNIMELVVGNGEDDIQSVRRVIGLVCLGCMGCNLLFPNTRYALQGVGADRIDRVCAI